ncbi:unnamed protein product [Protopolystoma xenopodis]|uniref:Uncharacterized protein n=1 Tax=Protopolystoma xenopodis TaxID=117903 RepID=A0A3S4ZMD6_9PLAT|nr:unnamed protein product [Protopolystoma xenopodis]
MVGTTKINKLMPACISSKKVENGIKDDEEQVDSDSSTSSGSFSSPLLSSSLLRSTAVAVGSPDAVASFITGASCRSSGAPESPADPSLPLSSTTGSTTRTTSLRQALTAVVSKMMQIIPNHSPPDSSPAETARALDFRTSSGTWEADIMTLRTEEVPLTEGVFTTSMGPQSLIAKIE